MKIISCTNNVSLSKDIAKKLGKNLLIQKLQDSLMVKSMLKLMKI